MSGATIFCFAIRRHFRLLRNGNDKQNTCVDGDLKGLSHFHIIRLPSISMHGRTKDNAAENDRTMPRQTVRTGVIDRRVFVLGSMGTHCKMVRH